MRLFVALAPPAEVLTHADQALRRAREQWPDLRWIPVERWHLTLAFYGDVADEKVERTIARLEGRVAGHASVELRLSGAGAFSRRALWLGLDGELSALRRLARAVTRDQRRYRPHLTVARLRGAVDATGPVESLSAYDGPFWTASTVHLVRSHLGPSPTYGDVAVFRLEPRS